MRCRRGPCPVEFSQYSALTSIPSHAHSSSLVDHSLSPPHAGQVPLGASSVFDS